MARSILFKFLAICVTGILSTCGSASTASEQVSDIKLSSNSTAPIVDLGYAKYQGAVNTTTNISYYLGIRYAAPPTGEPTIILKSQITRLTGSIYIKVNCDGKLLNRRESWMVFNKQRRSHRGVTRQQQAQHQPTPFWPRFRTSGKRLLILRTAYSSSD